MVLPATTTLVSAPVLFRSTLTTPVRVNPVISGPTNVAFLNAPAIPLSSITKAKLALLTPRTLLVPALSSRFTFVPLTVTVDPCFWKTNSSAVRLLPKAAMVAGLLASIPSTLTLT